MKKEYQDVISEALGVKPILINSALVSAQNRKRLYWTNIPFCGQPNDRGVVLKDIIEIGVNDNLSEKAYAYMNRVPSGTFDKGYTRLEVNLYDLNNKSRCLTANSCKGVPYCVVMRPELTLSEDEIKKAIFNHSAKTWHTRNKMGAVKFPTDIDGKAKCLVATNIKSSRVENHICIHEKYRLLTTTERERVQTIPDGYCASVSDAQAWKMLGNGWNIETIVHLFQGLKYDWF